MGRVGFGFDVHPFIEDAARPLILGGVAIESSLALKGHSDADVIGHAITDAVLGAVNKGDMGDHFPDTDPIWAGANSLDMLAAAVDIVRAEGFRVVNIDCTIVTEKPAIAPHRERMQTLLGERVGAPVSVKASRAEGLGSLGRLEGAACWAVAMLEEVQ
jgi:2-C-methyl-D-erythritol 2,4-cyclodiphosphate synthase